ncbi:MAG: hypothetical protein HY075_12105, partial [Deltaproteobacteria bacterium]|nr:hypothetical protein [Deltaproteobacteria bacterium]
MALATVSVVAGCQPKGQKSASGSEGASSSSKATITIGFAGGSTVGASRVSSGSSSSSSIIAGGLFGGGAALASSSFPTTGAFFMPGSISDFDCFAVNVIAPDIQTNSACGGMARMGLAGGFVSGHGGLLQLDVPFGAKRTFQIWGFAKSSFCPDVTRLLNLQKGAFPGGANSPGFMLAQTTVDVFQREMTLDIQPKFNFGSTPQMCGSLSAPSTSFDSMVFSGGGHPALPNHSVSNNSTDDVCVKIHTSTSNPAFTCTMVKNGVATALPAGTCTPGVGTGTGTCVGVTNPGGYVFTIPKQGVPGTVQSVSLTITSIDQSYGVIDPSPPTFDFTIDLNLPVLTFSSISPGKQYPGGAWYTTSPSPIGSLTLSKAGTVFETQGFLPPFPGTYSQCNAVSGPAPLLCLINPVLPAFGVYDVSFMANDAAGNLATAISQKVAYINPILTPSLTVSPQDTFTPSLSWLMGGDLDGSAGPAFPNASVVLHASQPGINGELNIVDNTTYLCTIDGAPPVPCGNASAVGGNPIDFTVVASSVHGGKHTLAATASNFAGTPATPINQTVYVDSLVGQPAVGSFYTGDPSLGQVYGGKYLVDASSSNVMMAPMPSDTGLNDPGGVALDPVGDLSTGWLYVADIVNSRVLAYPWDVVQHRLKSHAASFVYGQASLSSVSLGADAANGFPATSAGTWRNQSGFNLSRMLFPFAVAVGNVRNNAGSLRTKLWVSDTFNNRVLQFDVTGGPALNKMKAELILGQDVDTGTTANAHLDMRNDLNFPTGLTFYSQFANQGILYVADTNNCRVVGYDVAAINATTAMPYVGVAKNASFHVAAEGVPFGAGPAVPGGWTCGPNGTGSGGLGSTSLFSPYSVAVDATGAGASPPRIFVGDSGNPRVPYWDLNTATGAPLAPNATGAIGQTDANTFTADGSGGYGV